MKCPLFVMTATRIARSEAPEYIDCLKEECAWWDKSFGWCSEQTKAHELHAIATELAEIRSKMPYAGQFTK